ncbi:MAG: hypothetical protein ACI837_003585 [Crocinitomicaceae bacterium]|jgi:hypothetical protein
MLDFTNKESIFQDPEHTKFFNENGYVVVPFLSQNDINELLELYKSFYPNGVEGFFTTTFANNVEHREKVNTSIRSICLERTNELLENYQTFFSSFIVKAPGPKSELIMHQDMTLLDERTYTGTNIWCPLVDLTDTNGAIEVLPKSHRFFKTFRGSSIPDIYDAVVPEVKEIMTSCKLKAGEAIVFDQSIIHYSPPNLSDDERPVINTFVAHKNAQIKICYWDKESGKDEIEIFEQENDFLEKFENFGHNIFSRPSIGKSLGLFPYDFPKLTVEMLEEEYDVTFERPKVVEKKSWLKRILTKEG